MECLCGARRCVDIRLFNDSKSDCDDGSDEPHLLQKSGANRGAQCPDGSPSRGGSATNPFGAQLPGTQPMVPCEPHDARLCSLADPNEMCIVSRIFGFWLQVAKVLAFTIFLKG